MKRCPTCSRVYDDLSLRFCFDDGTELVNRVSGEGPPATAVIPPENVQPTLQAPAAQIPAGVSSIPPTIIAPRKSSRLPWVLGAAALLLLVGGIAVAGVILLFPKKPLVMHLVLEVDQSAPDRDAAVARSVAVIESRLDALGVSKFQVKAGEPGSGRVLVDLPELKDPERIKKVISNWGKLELVHVISSPAPGPVQTYPTEQDANAAIHKPGIQTRRVLPYRDGENSSRNQQTWIVVESPAIVDGSSIRNASAVVRTGEYYDIEFSLNQSGAQKFGAWTGANINEYIGVALNDEVMSVAYIKSQILDRGEISGAFTKQTAEDLALILKAGALPFRLQFVEEKIDAH